MTGHIGVIQCIVQVPYLKHDISLESRRKFEMKMLLCPFLVFAKQIKKRKLRYKNSGELLHPGKRKEKNETEKKAKEKCYKGKNARFSDWLNTGCILVGGGGRQKRMVIENYP